MSNEIVQGKCPACNNMYDPFTAGGVIVEPINGRNVQMLYAICPTCRDDFDLSSETQRNGIANTCFKNVKQSGDPLAYTCTSSLAINAYGGEFYPAWVYGTDLPRHVFDMIDSGAIDALADLGSIGKLVMKQAATHQQSK